MKAVSGGVLVDGADCKLAAKPVVPVTAVNTTKYASPRQAIPLYIAAIISLLTRSATRVCYTSEICCATLYLVLRDINAMTSKQQLASSFLTAMFVLSPATFTFAQPLLNQQVESIPTTSVNSLVEKYCFTCHGAETQTAGINLHALVDQHPLVRNRETWQRVRDAVEVGKMPPATAPQPSPAERGSLVT